mmetsp:Transcript_19783/g.33934  ORF Transcript_19783/g.33934 Transcript_19783/m.33934 type:complete len:200 (-) Transcript_19783:519-1118(-)
MFGCSPDQIAQLEMNDAALDSPGIMEKLVVNAILSYRFRSLIVTPFLVLWHVVMVAILIQPALSIPLSCEGELEPRYALNIFSLCHLCVRYVHSDLVIFGFRFSFIINRPAVRLGSRVVFWSIQILAIQIFILQIIVTISLNFTSTIELPHQTCLVVTWGSIQTRTLNIFPGFRIPPTARVLYVGLRGLMRVAHDGAAP